MVIDIHAYGHIPAIGRNGLMVSTVYPGEFFAVVGRLLDGGIDGLDAYVRKNWDPCTEYQPGTSGDFGVCPSMGSDIGCCPLLYWGK